MTKIMTFADYTAEQYNNNPQNKNMMPWDNSLLSDLSTEEYLTLGQEYGEHVQMCLLTGKEQLI